jgi:hypothetical protein
MIHITVNENPLTYTAKYNADLMLNPCRNALLQSQFCAVMEKLFSLTYIRTNVKIMLLLPSSLEFLGRNQSLKKERQENPHRLMLYALPCVG